MARAGVVAQDFEHRKRPAQQRVVTRRRLDHHELPGRGRGGDRRRGQRQHVVVVRQPRVRDHFRGDIGGHRGSILHGIRALPPDALNSFVAGALAAAYVVVLIPAAESRAAVEPGGHRSARARSRTVLRRRADARSPMRCCWSSRSSSGAIASRRRGSASACWRGPALRRRRPARRVMWANVDTFGLVLEAQTTDTLWQSAHRRGRRGAAALRACHRAAL